MCHVSYFSGDGCDETPAAEVRRHELEKLSRQRVFFFNVNLGQGQDRRRDAERHLGLLHGCDVLDGAVDYVLVFHLNQRPSEVDDALYTRDYRTYTHTRGSNKHFPVYTYFDITRNDINFSDAR